MWGQMFLRQTSFCLNNVYHLATRPSRYFLTDAADRHLEPEGELERKSGYKITNIQNKTHMFNSIGIFDSMIVEYYGSYTI